MSVDHMLSISLYQKIKLRVLNVFLPRACLSMHAVGKV